MQYQLMICRSKSGNSIWKGRRKSLHNNLLSDRLTDGYMTIHKVVWPRQHLPAVEQLGSGLPSHSTSKGQRTADAYSQLLSLWCVSWGNLKWLETSKRNGDKVPWRLLIICDACLHVFLSYFYAVCTNWTCMFYKLHFEDSALYVMLYAVFKIFFRSIYRFNFVYTLNRCSCSNLFSPSLKSRLTVVSFICFQEAVGAAGEARN